MTDRTVSVFLPAPIGFPEAAMKTAFDRAVAKFVQEYGRSPRLDFVLFRGGFVTTGLLFELEERDEDE